MKRLFQRVVIALQSLDYWPGHRNRCQWDLAIFQKKHELKLLCDEIIAMKLSDKKMSSLIA